MGIDWHFGMYHYIALFSRIIAIEYVNNVLAALHFEHPFIPTIYEYQFVIF
jgi:hypothetical protein